MIPIRLRNDHSLRARTEYWLKLDSYLEAPMDETLGVLGFDVKEVVWEARAS